MSKVLDEQKLSVRAKLAALWTSFMFLYIYVDYFGLYKTGYLQGILEGKIFTYDITQGFIMAGLASVAIPSIMIFLSATLPAKLCRRINLVAATLYIPYSLFNLYGETPWLHMILGATVEAVLLAYIIRYTWKWPVLQNK